MVLYAAYLILIPLVSDSYDIYIHNFVLYIGCVLLYCIDAYSRESTAMKALFELFKCNKALLFEEIEVTTISTSL